MPKKFYYYAVRYAHAKRGYDRLLNYNIKTDQADLTDEQASEIAQKAYHIPEKDIREYTLRSVTRIQTSDKSTDHRGYMADSVLTIRNHETWTSHDAGQPIDYIYYSMPDTTQVPVTIVRTSQNNPDEQPYTDVVHVPACRMHSDPDVAKQRITELLRQIMEDFTERITTILEQDEALSIDYKVAASTIWPKGVPNKLRSICWNDLFSLPDGFLKRYNVGIEPIDTTLTLHVDSDEPMFEE